MVRWFYQKDVEENFYKTIIIIRACGFYCRLVYLAISNLFMKGVNISIILLFIFHYACKEAVVDINGSLIADGIETLNLWENFDNGLLLYNKYLSAYQDKQGYLDNTSALYLFSNTNQKKNYFIYLQKYIAFHGEKEKAKGWTNEEFYNIFESEIDALFHNTSKEYISETDSLIIVEYLIKDQEIRRNGTLTKERDSLLQIPIKSIIAQRKYNNKYLREALYLLMRHSSPIYLKEFKNTGLLEHYASISLLSKEEYYSAVGYKNGAYSIPESERENAGLLPSKFSYSMIRNKSMFSNFKKLSSSEMDSMSVELIKYLETI